MKKEDILKLVEILGFQSADGNRYEKKYEDCDYRLGVDMRKSQIIYQDALSSDDRQIRLGDKTTSNFGQDENFVVLECVDRLLTKGYRPEDITLEKRWQLGHGSSGGKADVCVARTRGDGVKEDFLIFECKTWGAEFRRAIADVKKDGGQLFSYFQQERSLEFLCLYTSRLHAPTVADWVVEYDNAVVKATDDRNLLGRADKDPDILLFRDARNVADAHLVWCETYGALFHPDLVFIDDARPYQVEIVPLRKKRLKEFANDDCGYVHNQFAEILRHNNISDKENAFNKLISLFICKVVDEQTKGDDDVVEFQYREGSDTYESLQDRLLRLYKKGMEEYLREEIFYVPDNYMENALRLYRGDKRKHLLAELNGTLRKLKFYTNNEFTFKEVHNEELFLQNSRVLVEVVQLLQNYRVTYAGRHQFLGNLFELLLNDGFKQSEGQFFTPMPVTRFIWDALPLERLLAPNEDGGVKTLGHLRMIDYACGSGHFLTEGVEAVVDCMKRLGHGALVEDNGWVGEAVYGIERDYRLARVSKIAMFLNGAGYGNIVFGDGLEHDEALLGKQESFDILVANPPYSVKAFKSHLRLKNNDFDTLQYLTDTSSEIESLFVERINQLLRPGGVAAVLLPASILSNASGCYIAARRQMLHHFRIRAIAELGSKTFIATGTNTIVMFLEKNAEPPKLAEIATDFADAVLAGACEDDWSDQGIFEAYLETIGVEPSAYAAFVAESARADLAGTPYFQQYIDWLEGQADYRKLTGTRTFQSLDGAEREARIGNLFYKLVKPREREKLHTFFLVHDQQTLIIKAPTAVADQKTFLGYEWSTRRGDEGLKIINEGGKLYNPSDRRGSDTLAAQVRAAFDSAALPVSAVADYATFAHLRDMIDFGQSDLTLALRMSVEGKGQQTTFTYRFPARLLGSLCDIFSGGTPDSKTSRYWGGGIHWATLVDTKQKYLTSTARTITDEGLKNSSAVLLPVNTVIFSTRATIGDCTIAKVETATNQGFKNFVCNPELLNYEFLYYVLIMLKDEIAALGSGMTYREVSKTQLAVFSIPVPPLDIQAKIVAELEGVEREETKAAEQMLAMRGAVVETADGTFQAYSLQPLGTLCRKPEYGANVSATVGDPRNDIRYIRVTDIDEHGCLGSDWKTAQAVEDRYLLETGDFLFARSGATAGKTLLYDEKVHGKAIFAGYLIRFRCDEKRLLPAFLNLVCRSHNYLDWVEKTKGGLAQPNINAQQFSSFLVPVPSLTEQQVIIDTVSKFQAQIAKVSEVVAACPARKQAILRKWLVAEAPAK